MNPDKRDELYNNLINSGKVSEAEIGSLDDFKAAIADEASARQFHKNLMGSGIFGADEIGSEDDFYSSISSDFGGGSNEQSASPSPQRNIEKRAPRETYQQAMNGMPVYEPGASVQTTVRKPEEVKTASSVPARKKRQEVKPAVNGSEQTEPSITEKMDKVRRNVNPQAYFDVYGRTGVRAPFATAEATAEYDNQRPEVQLQRRLTGYGKDFSTSAESAWNTAMEKTAQEQGENIKMISRAGGFMPGGSGMGQLALINKAARLRNTDMEVMTSNAWEALGKEKQDAIVNDYYQQLIREQGKNAGEGAGESTMSQEDAERILREQAEQMAKARQWQAMYDKAVEMNAPKDVRDFMFRKIVEGNTISKLVTGAARVMAGTRGDLEARDVAMQNYEKDGHKVAGIAGSVLAIATDPVTYVSGGAGGAVTKAVAEGVGKAAVSQGIKQGTRTLAGRVAESTLPRVAGGATNFALFEGLNNAVEQARMGGVYDPETGEYTYDMGEIGKAAGHGVLLGAASGVAGGLIGNVGDKIYKNIKSTAGKVGERIGEAVVSDAAMGTIFAAPELIRGEGDFDTWLDNVEMMVGFRLSHGAKAIPQRFEQLRRNPESRAGFETRLRKMLDSRPDLALNKDEAKELNDAGYKDLKELVEAYKSTDGKLVVRGEEIPYNRFEELMNDNRVSKAAKAKMYYYVTGKLLPEPTVLSVNLDPILDADGKPQGYVVESKNEKGEVVTRRNYRSENEANIEFERLGRQAELNSIEMLELLYDKMSSDGTTSKMLRDIIGKEYKVDIDKAIGKEPNRRSDSEKKAIEEYTKTMLKDGYEAWERSQRDAARKQIEGPYKRGYEADEQGRRDITIEAANGDKEAEEAMSGVKQRIEDDADAMVERDRDAFNLQRNDEDGALHPATMTVDGEEREVYIKSGNIVLDASGAIDVSNSGETIVVYDPVEGKNVMVSPQDLSGVGEVTTGEQYEAGLQAQREAYVQQQQDAATGRFNPQPGQQIEIPDAGTVTVLATDGESVTLQMPDGTQQSMSIADIQSIVDAMSMEDYRQRHPESAAPESVDEGRPGGLREGVPEAFEPDMDVLINEDGRDKVLRYIGRARLVDAKGKVYEPDEEGSFLAFYDPTAVDQARYVNTKYKEEYDAFLQKVVGYKPAEQEEAPVEEHPTEEQVQAPVAEQTEDQQDEQPTEKFQQAESSAKVERPAVEPIPTHKVKRTVGGKKQMVDEEDWMSTTPERAYTYLYEEAVGLGLPIETADNMVAANLKEAQKDVERAKTATGSVVSVLQKQNAAQAAVEYWEQVKRLRSQAMLAAAEAEAERTKEQRAAEAERAAERREQRRNTEAGQAGSTPAEKYNASEKIVGNKVSRTIADKTKIRGHYVLVEADALTPSHDPFNGWKVSEGFPTTEDGKSVNDRVYENDKEAQDFTESIALVYDGQAVSEIPVVSSEGIVYDGNGRTMAGQIAARNNTDAEYIEALVENAANFGFTEEQVQRMSHPRVVMQVDEDMPYNATTFARFNKDSKKKMNNVNKAVSIGKQMTDSARDAMLEIIDRYGTIDTFFGSEVAAADVVNMLVDGGFITQQEVPAFREKNSDGKMLLSADGRSFVTNTLLGTLFDEEAIRRLGDDKELRNSLLRAIPQIAENRRLGDYALTDEINTTINLLYEARKSKMTFDLYKRQGNLVEGLVEDRYEPMVVIMADLMSSGVDNFRDFLSLYNQSAAADAASGGENLFGKRTKEDLKNAAVEYYKAQRNGQYNNQPTAVTNEGRVENTETQSGVGGLQESEGDRRGEPAASAEQPAGSLIAESIASQEVNGNPSEAQKEAGNYKKAHVKVDGFDVTIENKKGGTRSGVDPNGKAWSQTMHNDYGYIRGTEGVDGDHIDVFLSDTPEQGDVFVVDQVNADGSFDEHKVMYGFPDMESARKAYLSNYEEGWQGLGSITPVSKEEFKKWVESSHRKTKPFSEYKSVKTEGDVLVERQSSTAEDVEAGGAVVDRLQSMGVEVGTDIAENRKVRKQAERDNSESGKIHNLKTSDGKVYGFAYRGKLYLDPRKIDAELPLHEYGHLWTEAFRILNPEGWKDIVETIKQDSKGWEMVKELYPDLKSDSEIADEVIATFSGKNGAERLKAELERMAAKNPEYKSRWGNIYQNIVKAIQDLWKKVGDFLGIKYETPEQVYDQVLRDFAAGMNPRARVEKYLKERDAEYMNAVESGDEVKAKELFDAALRENIGNGMTPYLSVDSYIGRLKNLVKRVKSRDPQVILQVAELMSPLIPQDAVLVPAPSHTGEAKDMLDLSEALSRITGAPVANVLRGVERESQYQVKKEGGRPLTAEQMGIVMDGTLPDGKIPVVIDNVVDSGNTAEACVKALGKGIVVSLAEGVNRRKHAATLKSANVVARDRSGNIVPLSRRFDLDGVNYLAKQKGDGKVQKPTKEQKVMVRSLVDLLNEMGVPAHLTVKEGQAVLDKYRELVRALRAYHGSGADFDAFDHSHMGEGEGAQAYGYGTYVTEVEGIGKRYAEISAYRKENSYFPNGDPYYKGERIDTSKSSPALTAASEIRDFGTEGVLERAEATLRHMEETNSPYLELWREATQMLRHPEDFEFRRHDRLLYEVDIPDDNGSNYLVWDKPVTPEQQGAIYKYLRDNNITLPDTDAKFFSGKSKVWTSGNELHYFLSKELGSDKAASEFLHKAGFTGIKYPAQYSSGGRSDGAKNYVIFDENDLKIVDKIRFHKADDGEYVPDMNPVFYSNAMKAVEGIKQEKATPEQWIKMIEKAGGLKAGEDKWTGLSEWLKGSDNKSLTKQEVMDYLLENQIEVEEVNYTDMEMPADYAYNLRIELDDKADDVCGDVTDEYQEKIEETEDFSDELEELETEMIEEAQRRLDDEFGISTEYFISFQFDTDRKRLVYEPIGSDRVFSNDFAQQVWKMRTKKDGRPINETRLSYTTDGLDNKREIALTVPTIEPWNEDDEVHFGDAGEGRAVAWVRFGETTIPSLEYEAANKAVDDYLTEMREKYNTVEGEETDHMSADEIKHLQELTSKMIEERERPGRKVLVIDEIQSKRHQEGREKGYKKNGAQDAVTKANIKRIEAQSSYDLYVSDLAKKYDCERDDIYSNANDAEIAQVEEYKKAVENAEASYEKAYQDNNGVPDAPFDKNWHEVAFKRMLRYAAVNGFDKVAWTTGEQQAERYDLGEKISKIDVSNNQDGTKLVTLNFRNRAEQYEDLYQFSVNNDGRVVSGDFADKELSDVVGKEMAKKIMAVEQPSASFSGEDLRVGADGMKGFYDQILPRFVDKYTKKWGTKTSEVQLPNIGDNGLTMWSVDVTPEMKADVMEGQPMFFKTPEGEVYGFTLGGEIYIDQRYARPDTPIHEYTHLWAQALRDSNPTAWARLKEEMVAVDGGRLWNYVQRRYPELTNEDDLVEEVFAHYSGKRGGERLEADMREEMAKADGVFGKAQVANIFHKLRELLNRFWTLARDLFAGKVEGVEKLSAEDFADMALGDLMRGFDPRGTARERTATEQSAKEAKDKEYQKDSTYTTRDGVQLSMMSLFEEGESGVDGSNGSNGKGESTDITNLRLRKLAPGEMCLVERRYEENKQFSFTGSEKIESMDDVAYIFKQLEDAAVENVFLALVKDGKPTVIHIGMGTYAQSSLDFRLAFAAYKDIQPDAVYVVHNHPSGALKASKQDRNMLYNAKMYFGNDVVKDGIIIDTVSGKYGVFGFVGERENAMPESADHEVSVKTYEFSKQVFNEDWNPEEATQFADSEDIAAFISSQRLGEHPKMSFIVVNNQMQVVGNYFLPWTSISEIDDFKAAADELSNYVQLSGGTRGILYGNYQYDNTDKRNLQKLAAGMKSVGTPLTDVLHIDIHDELGYHSANDSEELTPEKEYEAPKREAGEDYLSYAKRIVEDRNAYEAIVKAYEAFNSGVSEVNEPGVEEILNDGRMGMREKITATAIKMANEQRDNMELRNAAVRAIGGNLMDIRKAMSLQREYDKGTVKRVADLARVLVKGGYLEGATNGEMSRILSIVKNATGKTDITGDIRKLMEIMVDSQLRRAEKMLSDVESIKGSKVDAKGVEVQGKLDVAGQQVMKTFKETRGYSEDELSEALAEAENRMGSDDAAVAEEATNVRAGLLLSQYYEQNIRSSKTEERELKLQLDDARHATDRSLEFENTILESIQQNRVERLEAYSELMNMLGETLQKSIDAAKEFTEADKERVREIQHDANSDMAGRPAKEHYKPKWKDKMVNNSFVQFFFKPLATFDQMLRLFGSKSANGEGYLYNRFMRGWVDAREKEIRGVRGKYAVLDEKVKTLFGKEAKNMAGLIRLIGKMPKATLIFKNDGELEEFKVTQGNLMYIYMVNKMLDGRMKLRKMGIDEKTINEVMRILDPRLMELADWMQEDFLVDSRNEYNETHKRLFGAPMAAIEHYFPLKINPNARVDTPEALDKFDLGESAISTKTGSIIKRRRNALALDILNADALNVILDHVAKMEHWNAFAEFNRDLNTLRTYKRFRNQVFNMTSVYGGTTKDNNGQLKSVLWENFNKVSQMAAGTYRPKRADLDVAATNLAKGVTAAKVSFRIFTALKQFLSMPAYLPDARPDLWAKNLATPWKSWSWAMENLPIFEERWKSRMAGDPRLLKSELDWKGWRNNIVQMASKIGMSPNAFVDALTVSIGAKTIYESRKARYLKEGYSEEQAERKAKQDAEIAYNQTQQSSEGAFLSTMQVDRSWLSVMLTVFRNSSMAYQRQLHDALRNLKRDLKKGNREQSIEFMTKQMVREGVDEEQAKEAATARYDRQVGKDALRVATFGFIMQFCWNLGAYLPYLLFGDDDDKKSDMWDDIFAKSMFGWGEGLTGGDVFSEAGKFFVTGKGNPEYLKKDMPAVSDVVDILKEFGTKKYHEAITDIINLVVQAGIGVNPQSITDAVLAIMDACGNDPNLARESLILYMRILQVPQSQIRELYLDEIDMTGEEASKLTPEQLAERYAKYQVKRGRFFQPWEWNNKDDINREKKNATKKIKERVDAIGGSKVNKAYEQYEEQYKDYYAKVKEYTSSSEYKDATPLEKAQWLTELYKEDPQGYAVYSSFKNMDAMLDKMAKYYLASSTPQEAQACHKYIEEYKQAMVDVLGAESDEERVAAREKRNDCVNRFYSEVGNMQKTRTKEEKMWKEYQKQMQKTAKDEYSADSMLK